MTFLVPLVFFSAQIRAQELTEDSHVVPYDFDHPEKKYILPEVLTEISGITLLNSEIMICIQDEEGDLFFYDLKEERILKRVKFAKDADYEDVVRVGEHIYVLRSNGTIYSLKHFEDKNDIYTKEINTRLSKKNNCEGLCYDPLSKHLLIALKGNPEVEEEQDFDGQRAIYSFDIEKEKVKKKPAYLINLKEIKNLEEASLYEQISHRIAEKFEESGDIRCQPSAIAVHPISEEIYVLASVGKCIIVMSRAGDVLSIIKLDKWKFVQPEGITFAPDGTLYISNEGDGGNGTIMKFRMKK